MTKIYLGQQFIDHKSQLYRVTDLYSAEGSWNPERMTLIFETDEGFIHLQGDRNNATIQIIGFIDAVGKRSKMTTATARDYEKKGLIKFG